jgi:protoporphyrinogen oxidase
VILGSGIAGISAGYHLKQKGENSVIFEKDDDWGGLCGFFTINGFRFDRFVHFTFVKDEYISGIFENSSPLYAHPSISYNNYHGYWLKHPAMTNLSALPSEEKVQIIDSFVNRPHKDTEQISNYGEWLEVQNGAYFTEHFAGVYTRKYWGQQPKDMETKWIGNRIYSPSLAEVLRGSYNEQEQNFYYTNYMKYPKRGGFRSILNTCREGLDIRFNKKVVRIDPQSKTVSFADGTSAAYERLISTLPLPEIVKMIDNCPQEVLTAAANLHWTKGIRFRSALSGRMLPNTCGFISMMRIFGRQEFIRQISNHRIMYRKVVHPYRQRSFLIAKQSFQRQKRS